MYDFEPHLQIIPLKRVRTRSKLDDAMRGERDVILVHNLPHTVAIFRDTVYLDGLPEDLILLMRLEFFHALSWEDRVFQALIELLAIIQARCETKREVSVWKVGRTYECVELGSTDTSPFRGITTTTPFFSGPFHVRLDALLRALHLDVVASVLYSTLCTFPPYTPCSLTWT